MSSIDFKRIVPRQSPMQKGVLVLWNDEKGFGFVRPENGGDDHFLHISAFKKRLPRRPGIGDVIHFRAAPGRAGKCRVTHAVIEGLENEAIPQRSTPIIPKRRSPGQTVLILTPLVLSSYLLWRANNPIPFFAYAFFSVLTLLLYGTDKTLAARRRWRVPESYLHVLEFFGGWPGALIAQNNFRHKTRKGLYQTVFKGIIGLHLLAWAAYLAFHVQTLVS